MLQACLGGAVKPEDAATPQAKRRKTEASSPSADDAGVLSPEKFSEIQKAALELKGKSIPQLAAMLARNELPKGGKKDELVERAAEALVLGVPPKCSICEKVRLKWSRATGKFTCP